MKFPFMSHHKKLINGPLTHDLLHFSHGVLVFSFPGKVYKKDRKYVKQSQKQWTKVFQ
jgi:hypothetical protein